MARLAAAVCADSAVPAVPVGGRVSVLARAANDNPANDNLTYDALGRVTSSAASGRALSYQYDLAGNRTRVTWPDASPNTFYAAYVYDLLGRVTQIEENGATSGPGLLPACHDQGGVNAQP